MRPSFAASFAAAALSFAAVPAAEARPQYLTRFAGRHPELLPAAQESECRVCHWRTPVRTGRNDYGDAVRRALGGRKNVKDASAIRAALEAAEGEPSSVPGRSFADLIGAGRLPGTNPPWAD